LNSFSQGLSHLFFFLIIITKHPYPLYPPHQHSLQRDIAPLPQLFIMKTGAILTSVVVIAAAAPAAPTVKGSSVPSDAIISARQDGNWYVTVNASIASLTVQTSQAHWLRGRRQGPQVLLLQGRRQD
jgi:hypothetical protein